MESTSADLVSRIMRNDSAAEEELVLRYRTGMFTIVRRLLANEAAAEDVTQESLALALVKIRSGAVQEPDRLSGFLCSLARNSAIAQLRLRHREQPVGDFEVRDTRAGPLDLFLERERAEAVRQVLSELTPRRDRDVLHRFYIAQEPKESICADLGLSSLHFNRVIYRARERFRELYENKQRRRASGVG